MITLLCILHIGLLTSLFHKGAHNDPYDTCGYCYIKAVTKGLFSAEVILGLVVLSVTYLP